MNGFNTATETLEVKNAELDSVIADAQSLMDETNKPYDENTMSELKVSIADAENAKEQFLSFRVKHRTLYPLPKC